ncbi:hypothetical protein ACVB8X_14115 [Streptomyces sp. NRAIS4]
MTPRQTFVIAAIGGITGVFSLLLSVLIGVGLFVGVSRLAELAVAWRDRRRTRREDLHTCRAIDALGTTKHPKDHRG